MSNGMLGAGEYIMRCVLAKTICETLFSGQSDVHEVLQQVLNNFHSGYPENTILVSHRSSLPRVVSMIRRTHSPV